MLKGGLKNIVDDYTNMNGIEEYRQIRATSTLFVSGSGFERDKNKIPPSYYTLKHVDADKFSLVAPVEETSKGILFSLHIFLAKISVKKVGHQESYTCHNNKMPKKANPIKNVLL